MKATGIKGGADIFPTLAKKLKLTSANKKRIALEAVTLIRARAFPESGAGRNATGYAGEPYSGYSTKRIYVAKKSRSAGGSRPDDMPAPRGVTAKTIAAGKGGARGQTSKDRKTVRYDGGYSQYRASIGRSSGAAKNLVLTGQTARALSFLRETPNSVVIGFRTRKARGRVLDEQYEFLGLTFKEAKLIKALWKKLLLEQLAAS